MHRNIVFQAILAALLAAGCADCKEGPLDEGPGAIAGTVMAHDGEEPIVTPYDDCVLIMPSRRRQRGQTAVRFGRYIA